MVDVPGRWAQKKVKQRPLACMNAGRRLGEARSKIA
jgi:hypothetical protein